MSELNIQKSVSNGIKLYCINFLAMKKSTMTKIKGIIHEVSIQHAFISIR